MSNKKNKTTMTVVIKNKTRIHNPEKGINNFKKYFRWKILFWKVLFLYHTLFWSPVHGCVPICEMYSICILPAFKNDVTASCLFLLAHTFMNMRFLFCLLCLVLQSSVFSFACFRNRSSTRFNTDPHRWGPVIWTVSVCLKARSLPQDF